MAWDVEGTKRKIIDAATQEFTVRGPDGTTMERIAKLAGVNKERVYNYFGSKPELFEVVLREKLAVVAQTLPVESFTPDGIGEYAGRLFDYNCEHPELVRSGPLGGALIHDRGSRGTATSRLLREEDPCIW
jgi:AcrR family transcriptional regulator